MKKSKNIILTKKKTTVEFRDVDGWMFDLRYLVNGKETYNCQIIKSDVVGRVERLEREGFKKPLASENKKRNTRKSRLLIPE
jgi:hypothetical protein